MSTIIKFLKKFIYYYDNKYKHNPKILIDLWNLDIDYYRNILQKTLLTEIKFSAKSVKQAFENYDKDSFLSQKITFQEFFQNKYLPHIQKINTDLFNKKESLFKCNAQGHNFLFYLFIYYPEYKSILGNSSTVAKIEKAFYLFLMHLSKIPRFSIEESRFYMFTQQDHYYDFFCPSSLALQEYDHSLLDSQKAKLKDLHTEKKIDKHYFTGSYGIYFQLVFKPASWFGTENKRNLNNTSRYVFDAKCLLSKICKEMEKNKISKERFSEFIYFNPGWFFGKKQNHTISFTTLNTFLNQTKPFLEKRNELIIRWIIPVNLEYGLLKITPKMSSQDIYF